MIFNWLFRSNVLCLFSLVNGIRFLPEAKLENNTKHIRNSCTLALVLTSREFFNLFLLKHSIAKVKPITVQ